MDYAQIKEAVNMHRLLERYGVELDKNGRCACPIHGGGNKTAFSVSNDGQTWKCHTKCDAGGDIFTFVERMEGVSNTDARPKVMEMFALADTSVKPEPKAASSAPKVKPKETGRVSYVYRDKDGKEIYRVNRVDFDNGTKQCYQECNSKNTLPPEIRTLYNYDNIYGAEDTVFLCEGEKCADSLIELGFIGTTNPLGSKNWNDSYAKLLKGMDVVIMPDADQHGEKWRDSVLTSLRGVASTVRIINVPDEFIKKYSQFSGHDFADMVEVGGGERSAAWLEKQLETAKVLERGYDNTILGRPGDIFTDLKRRADAGISTELFNLNEWLPSLDLAVNMGDLIVIMAGTGVGKTRALHNLPYHIKTSNFAMFDLELSLDTLGERYTAMHNGISVRTLKNRMIHGFGVESPNLSNVFLQKIDNLTVQKMADRVDELEQQSQQKIHCVGIDYIGLMAGRGSAYEKTSDNVEAFKAWISETKRVGLLTTQVARPDDKDGGMFKCPNPFSAKNSGSIENSAQELLAIWKPGPDNREMMLRCWKYTHGDKPDHDIRLIANDLRIKEA